MVVINTAWTGQEWRLFGRNDSELPALDTWRDAVEATQSLRSIADRLNDEGIPTKRGGKWHPASVSRTIDAEARRRANADAALYRAKKAASSA